MSVCATATTAADSVIPISVATLLPETVPGVALYIRLDDQGTYREQEVYRLYRGPEFSVTAADLATLRSRGITTLYVSGDEYRRYQDYLRQNLDDVLEDDSVLPARRVGCLNEVVRDVLGDIFRRGDLDQRIEEVKELGEKTVRAICRDDIVLREMRGVLYHDYHTFTHSANVAFYCVMLARSLGINDLGELSAIATGGLLHDAGKLDIPSEILTKPGRLTDDEMKIVRKHPTVGFRKLSHRQDLSTGQLMMVYQHHEHVDGNGYPVHCIASELHEWSRICAVADVFEALTSNRPYRAGLSYATSCRIMQEQAGTTFDRDFLKCWMQIVSRN
jgi:HD-GYP domain-containing protein (c-di-GMP phosphodiesterase class II)